MHNKLKYVIVKPNMKYNNKSLEPSTNTRKSLSTNASLKSRQKMMEKQ